METDGKEAPKYKKFDLRRYLLNDCYKLIFALILVIVVYSITSIEAFAYHDTSGSKENVIADNGVVKPSNYIQEPVRNNVIDTETSIKNVINYTESHDHGNKVDVVTVPAQNSTDSIIITTVYDDTTTEYVTEGIYENPTTLNVEESAETTTFDSIEDIDIFETTTFQQNDTDYDVKRESIEASNVKSVQVLPGFNSSTLKSIVHNIQERVNKSLNDSLHSNENIIDDSEVNTTKTEVKNTTKTEDDYNTSYEMEDYDDDDIFNTKQSVTEAPSSGAFEAIRDLAGSIVESIYESYVPQGIKDLFKRMQDQNDQLEGIKLRSREENGGIGQFGRNLIKGLTEPFNQLMQGVRDYGSLDSDKNFFAGVASGVVSVADNIGDSFKDRVRAIFPGTLWCGDGDMARSAEVGLFFMTDSCCRRHDACKMYIKAGDTKFGLTNTGVFTRSHCECDKAFYRCLKRTNSVISSQIGLTYFTILGPQCFKREHPIMRCKRRTRITGQKCEEYDLDYNQPKMWQWFDNETF